ncbi:MAG: hypothetical protein ACOZE5_08055 [Verrucomicrobiota bacterium]
MIAQKDMRVSLGFSKGYISKLVSRGMPLTSVEDARTWCMENLSTHRVAGPGELTGQELARAHGRSRSAISKDIAAGMPVDSAAAGQRWRELRRRVTRHHRLKPAPEQPNLPGM